MTELAELYLVAVGQRRVVHRHAVDPGAGEAAHINDLHLGALHPELGVAAADGGVVEDEVTVGVASLMIHVPF